ncbi:N-acetylmuramoyl-L-alanine amidase [Proteiniphilum sp. X52]|uniref:N-acetylmuramoyl-L-alanine amidase family protein n=1 Tax=Proteiniphilum sp. X52 TaxID=2382159 RepID=UPI000F0A2FF4|nr:N-acetylmuramoyl-L-alanine amidase [Proteiniphilum sp. X52]RNC66758.1 N-acetylmuramoyl-L-alanine amidase [Proteiniphilum sp. X52]
MKIYFFRGSIIWIFLVGVFSLTAQDMAYPVEGDGVLSFLRRWNRINDSYVREFMELNADRLNAQGGLELGTVYLIPPLHPGDEYPPSKEIASGGTDPAIFGKKLSEITLQSDRLKDACFYIISGHGGPDPGAIAKIGNRVLHEDEYAYDMALRLARNLMMESATVYVIIQDPNDGIRDEMYLDNSSNETCMGEPIPRDQLDRLKQRVDKVNELYQRDKGEFKYIRAIDIHVDSRNKGKRIDVFFYHSDDKHSKLLATTMRDLFRVKYDTHQPGRGFGGFVEQRNLYVLRHLKPPSILVETGNIQNEFDRRRILSSNNRQALANWMAQAFMEDYKKSVR